MTRTDEAEWWFNAVYEAVQEIPHSRVTTYGHIARLLGHPRRARQVGICLKHLPSNSNSNNNGDDDDNDDNVSGHTYHHFHSDNVPWQRVINSKGMISHRGPGSAAHQATILRQEGVSVEEDGMGEFHVDFGHYGWFPDRLPSEEGVSSVGDEDGDGNRSEG
ncbi:hypothetical protein Egran_03849 [Elaphomyces granulatus]|uniref:Methylated-DNA-[protein]-cysteine S-methyltransferase DNA binding domain-containing protein n=1 Tax=Elaphomyces granulatus TaxID=519963 RepID=A0A232LX47_9EURO|nr:hypothetical protein Egran_03849 [Elaphomyces granulatus]